MSDRELRQLEQALATRPDAAELHRQRAEMLLRVGRLDASLAALDLAWRLGADVWHELSARLAERRIQIGDLELCYVPAGPFVMGSPDHDPDAAPPHLVELSAFYVAAAPLSWGSLREWDGRPDWIRRQVPDEPGGHDWFYERRFDGDYRRSMLALSHLNEAAAPEGLSGRYAFPSEAQWERVFRACYLRPDGSCPYGAGEQVVPEWAADHYDAGYYERSPRRDPAGPSEGELRVVRGIPAVPAPHQALFREAAREDGLFPVARRLIGERWLELYGDGPVVRPVFNLEATP